jgi:tRNA threonylcarbamoyladenosine biosynthesis protein TsaE
VTGFEYISRRPADTLRLGEELGKAAGPGLTVALSGTLGAGKTLLTKGIAKGLGVKNPDYVTSPTFTIHKVYQGRLELNHLDFYRLGEEFDPGDLGIEEILGAGGMCVIEWPDNFISYLGGDILSLKFTSAGGNKRIINVSWRGEIAAEAGRSLMSAIGVTKESCDDL